MKAIILAAGKGERLRPITEKIPKPMIEIKGKPILAYNIEWLKKYGITEIYINLHHLPHVIQNYFGDGRYFGVKIFYSYESELLGTGGAVRKIADEFWGGSIENPFWVVYGDNLYFFDLNQIKNFYAKINALATIAVYEREDVLQSGIVVVNATGRILKFIEKPLPDQVISHLVNAGVYLCSPEIIKYIPEGYSDFGKDIFPFILKKNLPLFGVKISGKVFPVDTLELLKKAIKLLEKE